MKGQKISRAAHHFEFSFIRCRRIRCGDPVAVNGTELKKRINAVERDEVNRQRIEEVLQCNLKLAEPARVHVPRNGEHTDIEIRTRSHHLLPTQHAQAVIGP